MIKKLPSRNLIWKYHNKYLIYTFVSLIILINELSVKKFSFKLVLSFDKLEINVSSVKISKSNKTLIGLISPSLVSRTPDFLIYSFFLLDRIALSSLSLISSDGVVS